MSEAQKSLKKARAQFLGVAGVATAMGVAISAAAIKGGKEIDRLAKAGRRLDTSIAGMRALELAAGEAGVSLSSLTKDMQTLDREVARGGKNATSALERLGLAANDLIGLEADQKLALMSDAIKDVGLTTGETTALLQDLGIRNREMVLALMAGGQAFADARKDIEDYGLAVSSVDASAIEAANDQMARVGLVSEYVSQQLAIKLLPALGSLAQAFTDAMRAGEPLRVVIDTLLDNLDTLTASVGVAVAAFGTKLVYAMALASGATGALSAAFVVLKGAIFATGVGALVIAAGYLIAKFLDLVKETGGWANALKLLGDVASGVWDGIVSGADAMGYSLAGVWQGIKSDFFAMVAELSRKWGEFISSIAPALNVMSLASGNPFANWGAQGSGITAAADAFDEASKRAATTAAALQKEAQGLASEGFDKARGALDKLNVRTNKHAVDTDRMMASLLKAKKETRGLTEELTGSGGGGGAAGAIKKTKEETEDLNLHLEQSIPIVDEVAGAFADWMMRGFKDFKSFTRSIVDSFKNMLREMIALAVRNKIMISLGMGGSVAGTAASAAGGLGGGGGILGSLTGGGGIFGSGGLAGGATGIFGTSGIFGTMGANIAGTIGNMIGGVGSQLAASMAGIGATLGAAVPIIGGVVAAVSFFKKSTKQLDAGLRVTVKNMNAFADEFKVIQTKRFWGLSKKTRTHWSSAGKEMNDGIQGVINDMGASVLEMAQVFGAGEDALDKFSASFQFSTKGMSDEAAQKKIEEEISKFASKMADMALDGLRAIRREGEESIDTLTRVYTGLLAVNDAFDLLGHSAYDATLSLGDVASTMVDAFGGLDAMTAAVGTYWENFYTEEERLETATRRLGEAMAELGVTMPDNRDSFREMIEGIDSSTKEGAKLYAELIGLSGAFAEITNAAEEMERATEEAAKAMRNMVRDILADLDLMPTSRAQLSARNALQINETRALEAAAQGDAQAVQGYLRDIRASSVSDLAYRSVASRVLAQLGSGLPSFSGGGWTGGAGRSGGIDGQGGFLSVMHPQERVIDSRGGDALVNEVRAMRSELAGLREENRQLALRADRQRKDTADTLTKWDRIGLPKESEA